jgi:beta-N-acetylhexosaminidase
MNLLRKRMRFSGVSMTDDLDMGAIDRHFDIETAIGRILEADIDMTLICHQGPNIETAFKEILKHLRGSREMKVMGIESVKRILALKKKYLEI